MTHNSLEHVVSKFQRDQMMRPSIIRLNSVLCPVTKRETNKVFWDIQRTKVLVANGGTKAFVTNGGMKVFVMNRGTKVFVTNGGTKIVVTNEGFCDKWTNPC